MSKTRRENEDDEDVDEIQEYYDCIYVSASDASRLILGFVIHHQTPPVGRLSFHFRGEPTIVFNDDETIDDVISRPMNERSMFMSWMECYKQYDHARNNLYNEFPGSYVW